MKKLILLFALTFAAVSCEKEEVAPEVCSCGVIVADGVETGCYYLEIKNDCSGNIERFCFDYETWLNNYVGESFCVYNVETW